MTKRISGVVEPMLCKLYREAMKRAFVEAQDKAFDYLPGYKFKVFCNRFREDHMRYGKIPKITFLM
jgi:hypothetical protein